MASGLLAVPSWRSAAAVYWLALWSYRSPPTSLPSDSCRRNIELIRRSGMVRAAEVRNNADAARAIVTGATAAGSLHPNA
jgi:hypothetical protein